MPSGLAFFVWAATAVRKISRWHRSQGRRRERSPARPALGPASAAPTSASARVRAGYFDAKTIAIGP